jgi:hypothetical protein
MYNKIDSYLNNSVVILPILNNDLGEHQIEKGIRKINDTTKYSLNVLMKNNNKAEKFTEKGW